MKKGQSNNSIEQERSDQDSQTGFRTDQKQNAGKSGK
nr:biofilm-forming protein [Peribacillus kribbensis]